MVFMAGRLQRVETVDDSSDDESGPPPLEDIEAPGGSVAVSAPVNADFESDDEPPALLSQSGSSDEEEDDEEQQEDEDGSDARPLGDTDESGYETDSAPPSASDGDDIPSLTGVSDEEASEESDGSDDDELPPDLDDPDVSPVLDATWKQTRHGQRLSRCPAFSSRGSSSAVVACRCRVPAFPLTHLTNMLPCSLVDYYCIRVCFKSSL
jgi:hypothetical protein